MNFKTNLKHISEVKHVVTLGWRRQDIATYLIVDSERATYYLILTSLNVNGEVMDGEIHPQMSLRKEME